MTDGQLLPGLVEWLNSVLPFGAHVTYDPHQGWLALRMPHHGSETFDVHTILNQPESQDERPLLATATDFLLSSLQDAMTEYGREWWPADEGGAMAMPLVEIDSDGTLTGGFAIDGRWVLRSPPLASR